MSTEQNNTQNPQQHHREDIADGVCASLFRAYDIRGIVDSVLTLDAAQRIGLAVGSEADARGEQGVIVGRDGRCSSPALAEALIKGLRASGRDVIDIGVAPTPVLYFATHVLEANSGVMVTGSHNGPEYNGMKIVIAGETLSEDALQAMYQRIVSGDFSSGQGGLEAADVVADYIKRIVEDSPPVSTGALRIVVDCGNGVAGAVAPQLFRALGHDVDELYCEVDGAFPHHHPDPSQPENLRALVERVKSSQADMGFAFDGDGDRLGVIDNTGANIWPDRQLMLLAKDVLSRNQGASIVYDVKCSRHLKAVIESCGGVALMHKTGHSLIKKKMKEVQAPLAGEFSGHIFFKERWYGFDDAMYTAARLLEIIMNAKARPADVFADMPYGVSTHEIRVPAPEKSHRAIMEKIREKAGFAGAKFIDIDGLRVEFEDGWGLIRASNTSPFLTLRFEADNQGALERIQGEIGDLLGSVSPGSKPMFQSH